MNENLPILLLKKLILLPNQEIRLEINNEVSKIAIDDAIKNYSSNKYALPKILSSPVELILTKFSFTVVVPTFDLLLSLLSFLNLELLL